MSGGHSRKKLDLTGHRYGQLTVLAPADNIGTRTAWRCRCDCGRELVIRSDRLRSGRTRSCGCEYGEGFAGCSEGTRMPNGAAGRASLTYIDGTCVEMLAAKIVRSNNTSGVPGVEWWTTKQRWRAAICFKGKRYSLGTYTRFEDAVKARKRAEEELHDRFLSEYAEQTARASDG